MTERFGEPDPCCCPCGCCDEDTIHSEIRVKFSGIGSRLGSAEWDREDGFVVTLEDGIVLVDECIWTGSGTSFRNDVLVRSCLALSELVPMDCSASVSFENLNGESCVISPVVP